LEPIGVDDASRLVSWDADELEERAVTVRADHQQPLLPSWSYST